MYSLVICLPSSHCCRYITGKMAIEEKLERAKKSGNKELIASLEKEHETVLDMKRPPGLKKRKGRA